MRLTIQFIEETFSIPKKKVKKKKYLGAKIWSNIIQKKKTN